MLPSAAIRDSRWLRCKEEKDVSGIRIRISGVVKHKRDTLIETRLALRCEGKTLNVTHWKWIGWQDFKVLRHSVNSRRTISLGAAERLSNSVAVAEDGAGGEGMHGGALQCGCRAQRDACCAGDLPHGAREWEDAQCKGSDEIH